jgi:3-oxoacyl-[acyl-carrier protein] reductase/2-[hydroxy(phenyl)methyl]-succinyl-CoA dehydrogenase BbsC subunit
VSIGDFEMKTILAGKVALILRAGLEPGPAIAHKLADCGATVVLLDEDGARATNVANAINTKGGTASAENLTSYSVDAVERSVDDILKRYGRIDILINSTPRAASQSLDSLTSSIFNDAVATVVQPSYSFLRAVVAAMRQHGYGRIVNISSLDYLGLPGKVATAAAHAGMFGMTRAVALEVARDNITVNNLVLGDIAADEALSDEEKAVIAGSIPVKRLGSLAEVAHAVAFFADEKAKYVTGQTFFVCGGKSIHFSMSI